MASPQSVTPKVRVGIYFSWGTRLWYIVDLGYDKEDRQIALLENCGNEQLSWVRVALFKNHMKEVKPTKC